MYSEMMPPNLPWYVIVIVGSCSFFWILAYVLIIRRGFLDQSYGMPVVALCSNIAWEIIFGFFYTSDYRFERIGKYFWPILDIGILISVLRYGRKEVRYVFLRTWFTPLIFFGIGVSALLMLPFVRAYNDVHGIFLGWADALLIALLFFPLFWSRPNLEGQSFYIALAMFLGNMFAYLWNRYFPEEHPFPRGLVLIYACVTLTLQAAYIVMVYRKCRALKINPWTRF